MNNTHLYVGDRIVDLKPGQRVTVSIKSIDVAHLDGRWVSYSNNLKGIWTENNLEIFGNANNEHSTTTAPYRINSGKVVQNGLETIQNASVILRETNETEFSINVYERFYDFFSSIDGLVISDINPIADSAWDATAIDTARTSTSGLVTVILNWGKSGSIYQYDYFLPCFYYHTIITSILEFTGLTLSGDILTDSRFTDLVIPFPGDEFLYPESVTNTVMGKAIPSPSYVIPDLLTSDGDVQIELNSAEYGDDNFDFIADFDYVVPGYYNLSIEAFISVSGITWNAGTTLSVKLFKDATLLNSGTVANSPSATGTTTLNYTGEFSSGERIFITISSNDAVIGVELTVDSSTYLKIDCNRTINRDLVQWNSLWPKISCTDLVKDFFTRFSIVPKLVGQTLYLKSIEDILTDRAGAVDWSGKVVNPRQKSIDFDLRYSQNNYFNYVNSDTVKDPSLGRGNLDIANSVVENSKDIFTSVFQNTNTELTGVYYVATIPVYDSTSTGIDTFADDPGLRLLTLKDRTTETAINFGSGNRTDYFLGYFVDPSQSKDTGWEYFIGQFYPSLKSILQLNKVILSNFNLNELDISGYDPHKIIYYGTGYGLINKIPNFVPSVISKVEFLKA